jgi:hypothetical protein
MNYKLIDLPNVEKIADILCKHLSDEYKTRTMFQSQPMELFEKFDTLFESIETVKPRKEIVNIAIVTCRARSWSPIHTDITIDGHLSAINFPIYNCKETYTGFYKILNNAKPRESKQEHGDPYLDYDPKDLEEIDRLYLHKAAIFNTQVPHGIVNNTDDGRIILSVRFNTPIDMSKIT